MPTILFFLLSALALFLAATILFGLSEKDIFLPLMLWSLPLFLH